MSIVKFDVGDRLVHSCLGPGEVVKVIKSCMQRNYNVGYVVKFDTNPPMAYNMSENPALVFPGHLNPEVPLEDEYDDE